MTSTDRTHEPSQDQRGTARPINSPISNAEHRVRTGCGSSRSDADLNAGGYVACCPERNMLTAKEWAARAELAEAEARRSRTAELAWEKHCKEAEAERDALKAERDAYAKALAEANKLFPLKLRGGEPDELVRAIGSLQLAESDLSTLKARVAEVLRPFWECSFVLSEDGGWSEVDYIACEHEYGGSLLFKIKVGAFRRAADLHAALTAAEERGDG